MDPLAQDERISAYLDGELAPDARAKFEAELAQNADLRQVVDELRGLGDGMQLLDRYRLDDDFASRVLRRAERAILTGDAAPSGAAGAAVNGPAAHGPAANGPAAHPAAEAVPAMSSIASRGGTVFGPNGASQAATSDSASESASRHWQSRRPWVWSALAVAVAMLLMVSGWLRQKSQQVAMVDETTRPHGAADKALPPAKISGAPEAAPLLAKSESMKRLSERDEMSERSESGAAASANGVSDAKSLETNGRELRKSVAGPAADGSPSGGPASNGAVSNGPAFNGPAADSSSVASKQTADRPSEPSVRFASKDRDDRDLSTANRPADENGAKEVPSSSTAETAHAPPLASGATADGIADHTKSAGLAATGKGTGAARSSVQAGDVRGAGIQNGNLVAGSPAPAVPPGTYDLESRGNAVAKNADASGGRSVSEFGGRSAVPNPALPNAAMGNRALANRLSDGLIVAQCVTAPEVAARSFQELLNHRGIALYDTPAERRAVTMTTDHIETGQLETNHGELLAKKQAATSPAVRTEVVYVEGTPEQILGLVHDLRSQPATYRALAVSAATSPDWGKISLGAAGGERGPGESLSLQKRRDAAEAARADRLARIEAPPPTARAPQGGDKAPARAATNSTTAPSPPGAPEGQQASENDYRHIAEQAAEEGRLAAKPRAQVPAASSAAEKKVEQKTAGGFSYTPGVAPKQDAKDAARPGEVADMEGKSVDQIDAKATKAATDSSDDSGARIPAPVRLNIARPNSEGLNFEQVDQGAAPATGWAMRLAELPPVLKSKLSAPQATPRSDARATDDQRAGSVAGSFGAVKGEGRRGEKTKPGEPELESVTKKDQHGAADEKSTLAEKSGQDAAPQPIGGQGQASNGPRSQNGPPDADAAHLADQELPAKDQQKPVTPSAGKSSKKLADRPAGDVPGSGNAASHDAAPQVPASDVAAGVGGGGAGPTGRTGGSSTSQSSVSRQEKAVSLSADLKQGTVAVGPRMQAIFVFQISPVADPAARPSAAIGASSKPAAPAPAKPAK
jgi:negative regulator of sigma E activity